MNGYTTEWRAHRNNETIVSQPMRADNNWIAIPVEFDGLWANIVITLNEENIQFRAPNGQTMFATYRDPNKELEWPAFNTIRFLFNGSDYIFEYRIKEREM